MKGGGDQKSKRGREGGTKDGTESRRWWVDVVGKITTKERIEMNRVPPEAKKERKKKRERESERGRKTKEGVCK